MEREAGFLSVFGRLQPLLLQAVTGSGAAAAVEARARRAMHVVLVGPNLPAALHNQTAQYAGGGRPAAVGETAILLHLLPF